MSEKDLVYKGKIKRGGPFGFKELYEFLFDAFKEEGYDFHESRYKDKIKGESKDVEIDWIATKEISKYFKFEIGISWIVLGLKPITITQDGKEKKTDTGTAEISFKASLIKDHMDKFVKLGFLKTLYDRFIIRRRIRDYENTLYEEVNDIIIAAKSFLAIEGQQIT